jgi:hypothetical protein
MNFIFEICVATKSKKVKRERKWLGQAVLSEAMGIVFLYAQHCLAESWTTPALASSAYRPVIIFRRLEGIAAS